jgi:transcriptional/translational regulatory protein YebC/TACO1
MKKQYEKIKKNIKAALRTNEVNFDVNWKLKV